ncbi:MAG TPA: hypothetical protein VKC62_00765 [Gaiellaceae bacterium]|nr:hypothetical protein [Gaiellaceae bacterium]
MSVDPAVAFRVRDHDPVGLEVRVNFGMLTGRTATQAEIDDLARSLRPLTPSFQVVSEERHEFGGDVEASVHQVVVEVDDADDGLALQVVEAAQRWAEACFASRHAEVTEI